MNIDCYNSQDISSPKTVAVDNRRTTSLDEILAKWGRRLKIRKQIDAGHTDDMLVRASRRDTKLTIRGDPPRQETTRYLTVHSRRMAGSRVIPIPYAQRCYTVDPSSAGEWRVRLWLASPPRREPLVRAVNTAQADIELRNSDAALTINLIRKHQPNTQWSDILLNCSGNVTADKRLPH